MIGSRESLAAFYGALYRAHLAYRACDSLDPHRLPNAAQGSLQMRRCTAGQHNYKHTNTPSRPPQLDQHPTETSLTKRMPFGQISWICRIAKREAILALLLSVVPGYSDHNHITILQLILQMKRRHCIFIGSIFAAEMRPTKDHDSESPSYGKCFSQCGLCW